MPRRSVSAVFDVTESVKQLESEIRVLTTRKQGLLTNIGELEIKSDSLNKEISTLSDKVEKTTKEAKVEADRITKIAQEKIEKANIRESESVEKLTELNNKIGEAKNLIKSNEGMQKNLDLQTAEVKDRIKKIENLLDLIKTNLKDI